MARVHFAPSTEDLRDELSGASPEQGKELLDLSPVHDKHTGDDIVAHGPGAVEDEPLLNGRMVEEGDEHGYGRRITDDEDLVRREGGSSLSAIANMLNAIIGAGAIGLPYALRQSGLIAGLTLLLGLGAVTDWTIRLIVLNAKLSSRNTYIGVMDACFGFAGQALCSFFQFAFAFGGCTAFCLIVGDTLPHVLLDFLPGDLSESGFFTVLFSRPVVIIMFTVGISYPLSLYRDIEKLSKASALALVSMVVILIAVATQGPQLPAALKGNTTALTIIEPGAVSAIGVISFAFVCHHNTLLIYKSLSEPTLDRFNRVTHISTAFSVLVSTAMALAGYLVFTDKTQGNVLNNFPPDATFINVARGCFGLNMFTTLPLEAFVCRESIETFFYPEQPFSQRRHIALTTAIVFSAMLISLVLHDLGVVLELTGGLAATSLAYVFPAACYLKLTRPDAKNRILAWLVASFGIAVAVLIPVRIFFRDPEPRIAHPELPGNETLADAVDSLRSLFR